MGLFGKEKVRLFAVVRGIRFAVQNSPISDDQVVNMKEVANLAQQHSSGRHHLYMYVDPKVSIRSGRLARVGDFDDFLLERRVSGLFGRQLKTRLYPRQPNPACL
jgi:hypothetical protein